ncbi:MAG: Pycsar system effector family protein [Bacteroidota bacterium]
MSESQDQVLAAARTYVTDLFKQKLDKGLVFHTLDHTEDVADACAMMADFNKLQEDDRFVLLLAAWFHDTGYIKGKAEGHEDVSVQLATDFFHSNQVDDVVIQKVSSAIRATRMPQTPISLVEQILCDADLMHLATADFKPRNELLKQEREYMLGEKISGKDWRRNNVQFLEGHKYYTDYGQKYLETKKTNNLNDIRKKKERKQADPQAKELEVFPYATENNSAATVAKEAQDAEKGVQTMFRTTSNNHFELSSLADGKANIMISVNAIIISVVLTVLLVRLPFYPHYMVPTIILVATCLGAMIFSILATRPSVSGGVFTEEDIRQKKANLLFFGNFYRMKMEEYQWGMNEMLKDKEYLYNSMIKDIYYLGVVLSRKYRLLRIAYTIFMWGLIATVIAFAAASIFTDTAPAAAGGTMIDY